MFIREEVMAESSFYKQVIARGEAKGEAKASLTSLITFLKAKFPGLESTPGFAGLAGQSAEAIRELFSQVVTANDRAAAKEAIAAAIRKPAS